MLIIPKSCTGCLACYSICPFNAIEIKLNQSGETYPEVNEDKCRKCNKCNSVCPQIHKSKLNDIKRCYAVYIKDAEERKTVASGGAATAFGLYVIKENGYAFGTAFDKEPSFKKASTIKELEKFRGSKYVHVSTGSIFKEVKEALLTNKPVLFVATPCQVDGLLHYLGKEYDNLITVDLICHGTPPQEYLKEHLKDVLKGQTYDNVTFRGKDDYFLSCFSGNKKIYSKKQMEDEYFCAFSKGLILRENCYSCPYAQPKRVGDITIGDFWGVAPSALNGYFGRKSVVLINTEKGELFFERAKVLFNFEERNIEEAVKGNHQLNKPSVRHKDRENFVRVYQAEHSFGKAIRKTSVPKEITCFRIRNAFLYIPRKVRDWIANG